MSSAPSSSKLSRSRRQRSAIHAAPAAAATATTVLTKAFIGRSTDLPDYDLPLSFSVEVVEEALDDDDWSDGLLDAPVEALDDGLDDDGLGEVALDGDGVDEFEGDVELDEAIDPGDDGVVFDMLELVEPGAGVVDEVVVFSLHAAISTADMIATDNAVAFIACPFSVDKERRRHAEGRAPRRVSTVPIRLRSSHRNAPQRPVGTYRRLRMICKALRTPLPATMTYAVAQRTNRLMCRRFSAVFRLARTLRCVAGPVRRYP